MYLKLAAALLGVLLVAWLGHAALGSGSAAESNAARSIHLVPAVLGGAPRTRRWRHPQPGQGDLVETGAIYAAGTFGPVPVLLDFFRGADAPHNGIACFLIQGESLTEEQLLKMRTLTGAAVFDVGVIRTPGQIRLVAATECTAGGCNAETLPFWRGFWRQWNWKNLATGSTKGVVPAAVILTQATDAGQAPAAVAQLHAELLRAVAGIDFNPARRLAAAQGG